MIGLYPMCTFKAPLENLARTLLSKFTRLRSDFTIGKVAIWVTIQFLFLGM